MKKPNVLFVCHESIVLPFIASFKTIEIFSETAGFYSCYTGDKKRGLSDFDKEILKKTGLKAKDINTGTPDELFDKRYDIIVSLCKASLENCPQFPGFPVVVDWSFKNLFAKGADPDPEKWIYWLESEIKNFVESGYFKSIHNYKFNMDMIINSLGDAVIAHDLQRRIFYFNSTAEEITGFSQEDVLGKDCHDVFPSPMCGNNCSFCDGLCLSNNFTGKSYKTSFYNTSGVRKDCRVNVVPMKDSDGILRGVTATLRDLTELNQVKEQVLKEQSFNGIIGRDPKMLKVFQQIKDLGIYNTPVHIYGDTGTGKELVARAIHNESMRRTGPFVPINCGALPEGLIESELFGHVKGAFSGAVRDKKGRFELAHKGTIFLDEIGDLPKNVQVKLLRFLQEGTLEKVGGEKIIHVDVRIISATNKNLKKAVKEGEFRDDLYYRLNVVPLFLPALNKRKSDIPLLCEHFLKKIAKRHGQEKLELTKSSLSALMDYDWPGNVRELENVMEYSVIHASGSVLRLENLPSEVRVQSSSSLPENKKSPARGKLNEEAVVYALEKAGGNKTKAAKILGVGRATLYRFLNNSSIEI